jgi:hypothetical protein
MREEFVRHREEANPKKIAKVPCRRSLHVGAARVRLTRLLQLLQTGEDVCVTLRSNVLRAEATQSGTYRKHTRFRTVQLASLVSADWIGWDGDAELQVPRSFFGQAADQAAASTPADRQQA